MSLELYQFPISHFCEKIRWALDYKHLDYRVINLLPGLHRRTTRKLAPRSYVPILKHAGKVIQDSRQILDYLDEHFPERSLTPEDPQLRREAAEWEALCDTVIGPSVRVFCYQELLQHPDIVIAFFATDNAWWAPYFYKVTFPALRIAMCKAMNINAASARVAEQKIEAALDRIGAHLDGRTFLVGDRFTRADLSAAAMLAPLFQPDSYGLNWPAQKPDRLQAISDRNQDKFAFATELYRDYR